MRKCDTFIDKLQVYITKHWSYDLPEALEQKTMMTKEPITKFGDFTSEDAKSLEELISELGETFHDMLFRKIRESGISETNIYRRANIDRKLFSKIRSNPAYHPRKGTVLALAIALQLSLNDTIELLAKAEYALSMSSKRDLIIQYFIEREIYDMDVINFALHEFDQTILGS